METVLLIAVAGLVFYVVYRLLHWMVPTWGTIGVNVLAGAGFIADYINTLPWGSVLDSRDSAVIAFVGVVIGNIASRLNGPKKPVGQP